MFSSVKTAIGAAALAAMMAVGMASSASAAVINMDPNDNNVLVIGNLYRTQSEEKLANETFSDSYFFHLPEQSAPSGTERVFYSYDVTFPVPEGAAAGIGIADLTFTIMDVTNSSLLSTVVLTDSTGLAFPGFEGGFNFTGVCPAPIDLVLTITGTALSQGGSYEATVAPVAAVPLPAPLLLFVSALVGIGFLGRRRANAA